jgi:hypothetical protein
MSELHSPPEREHSLDDPLLAHIKACLAEVLRVAEQVHAAKRQRWREAILHQFARDEEEGDEDSDEVTVDIGGHIRRLNMGPGGPSLSEEELEVLDRFMRSQEATEAYRRLTGWYKPARRQGPGYDLER